MGEQVAGAKAAKDLGVYLGQLYGWVKSGKLKNHKADGKYVVEGGKGLIVDIDEARAVWMGSKKKGPRGSRPEKAKSTKRVVHEDGTVSTEPTVRRLKAGTIVSMEKGYRADMDSSRLHAPRVTVAQVIGSTSRLTFLDEGDHRRHFAGTQIDNMVFGTERLSRLMARGIAHIEHPVPVLGMVILSFIMDGKLELAEKLEAWMTKNDLEVIIPEPLEIDETDDEPEPVRGAPVLANGDSIESEDADA